MTEADYNDRLNTSFATYNNLSRRHLNLTIDGEVEGYEMYDMLEGPPPLHFASQFPLQYSVPIYGYIAPGLILLTVVTNTLVILVLLKAHMRSSTNIILAGMALSDTLTGVMPLPVYIYFFSYGHYVDFVPLDWCIPYKVLYIILPSIFHTASIWLTVVLAAQRYIYISHSLQARYWCKIRNVWIAIAIIYIAAFLSHFTKFIDFYTVPITVTSLRNRNETYLGCGYNLRTWAMTYIDMYQNIYLWFKIIFIHLVPCVSLVIFNGLLISAIRKAKLRRMRLLKQNNRNDSQKVGEYNRKTLMLVIVVGLFLLVELPLGIFTILYVTDNTFEMNLISQNVYIIMACMSNFSILLNYPVNIFIYTGMNRQFKETLKRLLTCTGVPAEMNDNFNER